MVHRFCAALFCGLLPPFQKRSGSFLYPPALILILKNAAMPGNDEEFPFFPALRLNYISVFLLQLPLITNLRKIGEGFRLTMCEEFTNNYFEVYLILFGHVFLSIKSITFAALKSPCGEIGRHVRLRI